MKRYLDIFLTMLKIGLFTFGGGYAMIAMIRDKALLHGWLSEAELLNMIAVAESTPGPIAINAATYIGYKALGLKGALLATAAVALPSFVIIFCISLFFDAFLSVSLIARAFRGIQVCVVFLIFSAGLKLLRGMKKKPLPILIVSLTVLTMILLSLFAARFSTVLLILIAGAIGIFAHGIGCMKSKKEEKK